MTKPFTFAYQHTPAASKGNAFCWDDGTPSIFMTKEFMPNMNGQSASEISSRAVREFEEKTGRSRGIVFGISKASDAAAEEFQRTRGRAPGHYRG